MFVRKLISSVLAFTMLVSVAAFPLAPASARADLATVNYLQNQSKDNAWVVMALSAAGQSVSASQIRVDGLNSATDIERTILAATAAGEDVSNFKNTNLIQLLDTQRRDNQIGNTTLINDDIFGILAYYSAAIPRTDARIAESREFILKHQNSDGGWSHSTVSQSDSNDTAMAMMALIRAGVNPNGSEIQKAINYLKTVQNNDGGFGISPGQESDSASTAWIISALQLAGQTPASWVKNNKTPFMFLESVKDQSNFSYKWKPNEGSGNATMTSYVVIALEGRGYPVSVRSASNPGSQPGSGNSNSNSNNNSSNNSNNSNTNNSNNSGSSSTVGSPTRGTIQGVDVKFRIEGSSNKVCSGNVRAVDPLHLVEEASRQCGFTYFIDRTSLGRYLQRVNRDQAAGSNGWLYLVNWKQPSVAADNYKLSNGDYVTWYFGEFDWQPLRTRLRNTSTASQQGNPIVVVEAYRSGVWNPVSGATVRMSGRTETTDSAGQAFFSLGSGTYQYYAERNGYVRSAVETLSVGINSGGNAGNTTTSRTIPLQTTVLQRVVTPPPTQPINNPSPAQVSFEATVQTSGNQIAGFGDLRPGQTSSHTVLLRNTGSVGLNFTASVRGDSLFTENIRLDNIHWNLFSRRLNVNGASSVNVSLQVPSSYNSSGFKTGDLIFWAQP